MAVDATMPSTVTSAAATSATTSSTTSTTSSNSTAGLADNFQTFLTLLTTQLQNQNPLDPLDTNQFTAQLVQFAQVEQQLKANDQLSSLVSLQKTAQSTQALSFVRGRFNRRFQRLGDVESERCERFECRHHYLEFSRPGSLQRQLLGEVRKFEFRVGRQGK